MSLSNGDFGSKRINRESVIDFNPDILIIPIWKSYNTEESSKNNISGSVFKR